MAFDQCTADFEAERARLQRLAYRMLGSLSEADDVVQDAWLRWSGRAERVDVPAAYLTRIVTRLCLDHLKSARVRRETYVGAWLPDPLLAPMDPREAVADDVTVTLMLAMERLSPLERAAFLLHDIFDVPLTEVAAMLEREPAAVRQLASRARKNVRASRVRYTVEASEADRIARAFFTAAQNGDAAALGRMLAEDVEIRSDGGGKVLALRNVVRGVDKVLRLFAGARRKGRPLSTLVQTALIDGLPGYISRDADGSLSTTALAIDGGRVRAIYIVRNPDKLTHIARAHRTGQPPNGRPA